MKRRIALSAIVVLLVLTFVAVKPSAQQPVLDKQRSRQELETMKGILETSIGYALKRTTTKSETAGKPEITRFRGGEFRLSSMDAFYLHGQGAVFVVPLSAFGRHGMVFDFGGDFAFADLVGVKESARVQAEIAKEVTEEVARMTEELKAQAEGAAAQQQPKPAPGPKGKPKIEMNTAKIEQKMEQRRAEARKQHEALLARVQGLKGSLKETLANYGDSLTIVKPDEWVTVVISGGGGLKFWDGGDQEETCHVIAVKKSLVTDLKAGKISREEFDRRVTDYSY